MSGTIVTSADGTTLEARWSGNGTPLVLVHGGTGNLDTFALVEQHFAERHAVCTYSRRGRGGSGDGDDYSLDREIEDVLAVLAAVGDDVHLVGHSLGALYCLLAAAQTSALRSLTLYEPPVRMDRCDPDIIQAVQAALDDGDPDRALARFFPVADITDEEAAILRTLEPVWERMRDGVRTIPREARSSRDDHRAHLPAIHPPDAPALYLYGEETNAPIYATPDEVARTLPDAQYQGFAGQHHLAIAFAPDAFAEAVLAFTGAHNSD